MKTEYWVSFLGGFLGFCLGVEVERWHQKEKAHQLMGLPKRDRSRKLNPGGSKKEKESDQEGATEVPIGPSAIPTPAADQEIGTPDGP